MKVYRLRLRPSVFEPGLRLYVLNPSSGSEVFEPGSGSVSKGFEPVLFISEALFKYVSQIERSVSRLFAISSNLFVRG